MKRIVIILFFCVIVVQTQAQTSTNKPNKPSFTDDFLNENLMNDIMSQLDAFEKEVKYEVKYTFSEYSKIKISNTNKEKTSNVVYDIYLSENASMMKMNVGNGNKSEDDINIIMDSKNKSMITLNEQDKSAIAINTEGLMDLANSFSNKHLSTQKNTTQVSIQKTGRTKTILGYACNEYKITNSDSEGLNEIFAWVTEDPSIKNIDFFSALGKQLKLPNPPKSEIIGTTLEFNGKNLKTQDTFSMQVLEISKSTYTKDLSTYKMEGGF